MRAFLFPGQGAQVVGMGKDFFDAFAVARARFEEADDLLEMNLSKVIFEGPDSRLIRTEMSQLALFVTCTALKDVLKETIPDFTPSHLAGLSLGEYTALCCAEVLSFEECLRLVERRAQLMSKACDEHEGYMSVIMGISSKDIEGVIKEASLPNDLWIANYNSPGQVVISGTKRGIEAGASLAKERGAKRVIPLKVQGAFHSGLMEGVQKELTPHLEQALFNSGKLPVIMNVTAKAAQSNEELRHLLLEQVTKPVKFEQTLKELESRGCDTFLEIGPSRTLSGMVRKSVPSAKTLSLGTLDDLQKLEKEIESIA